MAESSIEILRSLCMKNIANYYTEENINRAKYRVIQELNNIDYSCQSDMILLLYDLWNKAGLKKESCIICGSTGGAIVLYILGISSLDPLEYNLPVEIVFGYGRRLHFTFKIPALLENRVEIELEKMMSEYNAFKRLYEGGKTSEYIIVPRSEYNEISKYLVYDENIKKMIYPKDAEIPLTYCDIFTFIYHDNRINSFCNIIDKNNLDISNITIEDDITGDILEHKYDIDSVFKAIGTEYMKDIFSYVEPSRFDHMVNAYLLSHGNGIFKDAVKNLFTDGYIDADTVICSQDDVFNYVVNLGIDIVTAHDITRKVCMGLVAKGKYAEWNYIKFLMIEYGAADWFICFCENVKYIFPRAHVIQEVQLLYRYMWCKRMIVEGAQQ